MQCRHSCPNIYVNPPDRRNGIPPWRRDPARRNRHGHARDALIGKGRLAFVEIAATAAIRAASIVEARDLVADAAADIGIQVRQADIEVIIPIKEDAVFLLSPVPLAADAGALGRDVF